MNIIGRLTRDAEVRTTSQNKQVVNFSLAVNDSYRNKQGEKVDQTTFFDCSYWLNSKIAEYLSKGTLVELGGRPSARAWMDKEGEARAGLNFHISSIKFYGGGKKADNPPKPSDENNNGKSAPLENDVPF